MAKIEINNEYLGVQIIHRDDVFPHEGASIRVELASHDAMHFSQVIVDSESSHRVGDVATHLRQLSNGTHYFADVAYDLLKSLDAAWVEQNKITRETYRF